MGRYDNFSNAKRIEKAQKEIDRLSSKKNADYFKIDTAQKWVDTLKLFETCQIFGKPSRSLMANGNDPNERIMFSDDNRVMLFADKLIWYKDIKSYRFLENKAKRATTVTKKKGVVSRAIVGGAIAGGVGSLVGAATAGSRSNTTFYEETNGFFLQVSLLDGTIWQYQISDALGISTLRTLPKKWIELGNKLQTIIEENK